MSDPTSCDRWEFRSGTSRIRIGALSFFDARAVASMMLGADIDSMQWDRTAKRVQAEVRWVGTDAGRVPARHRELRARGDDGAWMEWRPG